MYVTKDLFGFIWNLSNCKCECGKSCDIGEYLYYSNCKCRKRLVDKLIQECTENIEETRLVEKTSSENEYKHKCSSCIVYIKLFSIILAINIGIGIYFVYYKYMNCNKENISKSEKLKLNQHIIILKTWLTSKIFTQAY